MRTIKFILSLILFAAIGFAVYKHATPWYVENYAPEEKKVYTWTDKNGVVHFSDAALADSDESAAEKTAMVKEGKFKEFGKDRFVQKSEAEDIGGGNPSGTTCTKESCSVEAPRGQSRSSGKGASGILATIKDFFSGEENWDEKSRRLAFRHEVALKKYQFALEEQRKLREIYGGIT